MLSSLYIENIAVARQLDIQFKNGFTVMTGKTGAGKSIIIDCLLLICGAKGSRDLIRTGEEKATVTAVFSVNDTTAAKLRAADIDVDENNEIEILRQITSDGKSYAKVNRRSVPVSVLKEITPFLVSIQTQNERNEYADRSGYADILDGYAGEECRNSVSEYKSEYADLIQLKSEISDLKDAVSQKEMMLDILRYQKKEIEAAKLSDDDEEEKLELLRNKLRSVEKITKYSSVVSRALNKNEKGASAAYLIERAEAAISQLDDVIENSDEIISKLQNFRYEIIDIAERISDSLSIDGIEDPTKKLSQVENRLAVIEKLKKKYGSTIAEIKSKREDIIGKISSLEDSDHRLDQLEKKLKEQEKRCVSIGSKISEFRSCAGNKLAADISKYLESLDMPKVRFEISVRQEKEGDSFTLHPDGIDDVDFLISVNAGEDVQSLGKVSSGGELSRITLALKASLSELNPSETMIFDEIDAGVSGGTSERIGIMLEKLSEKAQVIAVTHSSQIASIASTHLLIEKREVKGDNVRTESSVREISGNERTQEIARIIGGIDITEKQTAAASEMLSRKGKK